MVLIVLSAGTDKVVSDVIFSTGGRVTSCPETICMLSIIILSFVAEGSILIFVFEFCASNFSR